MIKYRLKVDDREVYAGCNYVVVLHLTESLKELGFKDIKVNREVIEEKD